MSDELYFLRRAETKLAMAKAFVTEALAMLNEVGDPSVSDHVLEQTAMIRELVGPGSYMEAVINDRSTTR